ncbi:MAG: hypothetical protein LIP03_13050 [Bacteroidales bacterium]|nr:hypothetical protein [Bacteroidales bacterium]
MKKVTNETARAALRCDIKALSELAMMNRLRPYEWPLRTVNFEEDPRLSEEENQDRYDLEYGRAESFNSSMPVPPHWINICLNYIFEGSLWEAETQERVDKLMEKNAKVLNWWRAIGYDVDSEIDFRGFYPRFYMSAHDETPENIMAQRDIKEYCRRLEIRPIDMALYCAGCRFDFAEVRRLMGLGANPEAPVFEPQMWPPEPEELESEDFDPEDLIYRDRGLYDRIGAESSHLTCEGAYWFLSLSEGEECDDEELEDAMEILLGLAAHNHMLDILDKASPCDVA